MAPDTKTHKPGPNLEALGLKSPLEIIDLLSILKIDGEMVVSDEHAKLDPQLKAAAVMKYFQEKFHIPPQDLPYLASLIKHNLKHKKIKWEH